MTQYLPIRALCQQTGLCEKTIRRLIRKHGLTFYRNSARGKILISSDDFEKYMKSTKHEIQKDAFVADILREFAAAVR
jgi:excisionase family DNA binding protein